ncbi:MAG TPA: alpha amylase N-terminal ig-like domain-containing protein [Chthonomonadaceae bacterium]|nr:alpha amylase N-terminal ig-like domain-containing protein [Chthonomonadaceae bacterium]
MLLLSILLALPLLSLPDANSMQTPPTSDEAPRAVVLRYMPGDRPKSIAVAGSFNDWNRLKNPMTLQPDGRTWSVTISLPPGIYQYLFVVDGARWINDPHAGKDENNGNSVLVVTPPDYDSQPGVVGDGIITPSAVRHRPAPPDVMRVDKDHFTFRLRTRAHDVASCWITLGRNATLQEKQSGRIGKNAFISAELPLHRYASDALYDYWRVRVYLPGTGRAFYGFRLEDGKTVRYYTPNELSSNPEGHNVFYVDAGDYPLLKVPDWVHDAVFYEIFPDRFGNGDPSNDPPDVQPWGSPPTHNNWMGGDLAGVMQHMDYLQQLGINALYFTPIFRAISNHAYDTTDYHTVDPRFGTNQTLKTLVARAHARGWHMILDGVFNHTGLQFFAFQSLLAEGARSPYRDWYFVKKFPIEARDGQNTYVGWNSVYTLPKLNVTNPATRDYLLDVGVRWIKEAGIDGWRLDSADVVNQNFWRAFRKSVRAADPNAYIVGEVWDDASAWLQGDQFDSVMNYRWRGAVLDFFVNDKISASQFAARLDRIAEDYPAAAQGVLFNLLGSHDTERIRTLCKGNASKERQAILFQMTYPGVPCIYYGDEVGLEGGKDPDCRRCMSWDLAAWNMDILHVTRQAIALRRKHAVFRRGDYRTALVDDKRGLFGFLRAYGKERALALFNRSDQPQTATLSLRQIGATRLTDGLTGASVPVRNGSLTVTLPPNGATVILGT